MAFLQIQHASGVWTTVEESLLREALSTLSDVTLLDGHEMDEHSERSLRWVEPCIVTHQSPEQRSNVVSVEVQCVVGGSLWKPTVFSDTDSVYAAFASGKDEVLVHDHTEDDLAERALHKYDFRNMVRQNMTTGYKRQFRIVENRIVPTCPHPSDAPLAAAVRRLQKERGGRDGSLKVSSHLDQENHPPALPSAVSRKEIESFVHTQKTASKQSCPLIEIQSFEGAANKSSSPVTSGRWPWRSWTQM